MKRLISLLPFEVTLINPSIKDSPLTKSVPGPSGYNLQWQGTDEELKKYILLTIIPNKNISLKGIEEDSIFNLDFYCETEIENTTESKVSTPIAIQSKIQKYEMVFKEENNTENNTEWEKDIENCFFLTDKYNIKPSNSKPSNSKLNIVYLGERLVDKFYEPIGYLNLDIYSLIN